MKITNEFINTVLEYVSKETQIDRITIIHYLNSMRSRQKLDMKVMISRIIEDIKTYGYFVGDESKMKKPDRVRSFEPERNKLLFNISNNGKISLLTDISFPFKSNVFCSGNISDKIKIDISDSLIELFRIKLFELVLKNSNLVIPNGSIFEAELLYDEENDFCFNIIKIIFTNSDVYSDDSNMRERFEIVMEYGGHIFINDVNVFYHKDIGVTFLYENYSSYYAIGRDFEPEHLFSRLPEFIIKTLIQRRKKKQQ